MHQQGFWKVPVSRWLLSALFAFLTLVATHAATLVPSIVIGNNEYSNVVVRETSDRTVTISHTRGMATISLDKMTRKEKENLGLIAPEPEPVPETNAPLTEINFRGMNFLRSSEDRSAAVVNVVSFVKQLRSRDGVQKLIDSIPPLRPKDFIAPVAAYLLLSMCFVVICAKAGKPAPLLGWLPLVQIFPLYRAANMSPFWFVALMLNVFLQLTLVGVALTKGLPQRAMMIAGCALLALTLVHLVGWIIWCFKISKARGKSPIVGFFMLLPIANLLALMYLTFSRGGTSVAPKKAATPQPIGLRLL